MADEDLRQLERDAAGGDPAAQARLLVERLRAGTLERARVELAAGLGHEPSAAALGEVPELEAEAAFRALARLGKPAWARGVVALLREPPQPADPQQADVEALLGPVEAWLDCPCEEHHAAVRTALAERRQGWLARAVSGGSSARLWLALRALRVVSRPDDSVFQPLVLCSGLSPAEVSTFEGRFAEAGCLTHSVDDSEVPERDRRRPRSEARVAESLGGEGLVVLEVGRRKIAVIAAVRRATGLSLQVVSEHLKVGGSVIPTGLSRADAEALAAELEEQGATVELTGRSEPVQGRSPEGGRSLVLEDVGSRKIAAIKEIRWVTGFGLREAKDIADAVDSVVPSLPFDEPWDVVRARLATIVPWLLG